MPVEIWVQIHDLGAFECRNIPSILIINVTYYHVIIFTLRKIQKYDYRLGEDL